MVRRCLLSGKPHQDLHKCYKVTTSTLPGHLALLDHGEADLAADIRDDDILAPDEHAHACPVCQKTFTTHASLCTHKMRAHDLIPPLSLRVKGTSCICCGSQLGTRVRLLNHLQERTSCGLYVISNVEPMDLDEYKPLSACPKRGKQPPQQGVATNRTNTAHRGRTYQSTSQCT
eukprot:3173444-Amphidinium_carterae.1